ncbi:MAG: lysophospholipid acyltransferase family protein [Bacilli bacterium]
MSKKVEKYKKPNLFVYGIFKFVSKIISKLTFRLKITRNELKGVKGGYVVIANHESSIDFINACVAIKRRAHFVVSNSFFQTLPIKGLLESCRVINKNQFQTDFSDMKKMKSVLDHNMPLVIYPAGMMSENGITTPIPSATGKVLKWFAKDVYVAYTKGSYLTNPKWSKRMRKGRITLDVYKLFSVDDLKNSSETELQKKIENALYYDAYQNQKEDLVKYSHGDDVEGLENVLYQCPHCLKEYSIEVKNKNILKCSHCGYEVKANNYGLLEPSSSDKKIIFDTPSAWATMIEKNVEKNINDDFKLQGNTEIQLIDEKKHKFVKAGQGSIILNKNEFVLEGNVNGEQINKKFPVKNFPIVPFKPGKCFELQEGKKIYRLVLENGRETMKWINSLKILHRLKQVDK